jgi:hypothetical protein
MTVAACFRAETHSTQRWFLFTAKQYRIIRLAAGLAALQHQGSAVFLPAF